MWSMVAQRLTPITPPAATPDQLWQRVEAAWSAVPQEHIQSLFESMPRHVYCQQLERLKRGTDQKLPELANRRSVVFHQDNTRTHTSIVTRQKLRELDWKVLMPPPYSPDLALNDYCLYLALQNFQSDKKLGSREDCENRLLEFFANKGHDFYERGNMKLPSK
ncbi:transposase [Trichonephila clavipes]|nr:transposase [Trichonephila clavipes]